MRMQMKKLFGGRGFFCLAVLMFALCMTTRTQAAELSFDKPENYLSDGQVNNGFSAVAEQALVSVKPRETAKLKVIVTADDKEGMRYTWRTFYDNVWHDLDANNEPTVEFALTAGKQTTYCQVTDRYGNSKIVNFLVSTDNELQVSAVNEKITISPLERATLEVAVSALDNTDMSYRWFEGNVTDDCFIEGAITATYQPEEAKSTRYFCYVTDKFQNTQRVMFTVTVNNELEATTDVTSYNITLGEKVTLKAFISAVDMNAVHWKWVEEDYTTGQNREWTEEVGLTLTVQPEYYCRYSCVVWDTYGSNQKTIYYYVYINNNLAAWAKESLIYVKPGEKAKLEAIVTANEMEGMTYQWKNADTYEVIEGAVGNTCECGVGRYFCSIRDCYGNNHQANFTVAVDNQLEAYAEKADITITPGENVNLKVIANANDKDGLTYEWIRGYDFSTPYGYSSAYDNDLVTDATEDVYFLENITKSCCYRCRVTDKYGNVANADFTITVENHLLAMAENRTVFVNYGEPVTLKVSVSADHTEGIKYLWYDFQLFRPINGNTTNELIVDKVIGSGAYICFVEDEYGNKQTVDFEVNVGTFFSAEMAQKETVVKKGDRARFEVLITTDQPDDITVVWKDRSGKVLKEGKETFFETEPLTERFYGYCYVRNSNGKEKSCYYSAFIENHFSVEAIGEQSVTVQKGETVTLKVRVAADDLEGLTFEGSGNILATGMRVLPEISDIDEDGFIQMTFKNIQYDMNCYLTVRDQYNQPKSVSFNIEIENGFIVVPVLENGYQVEENGDIHVTVIKGETVNLKVQASAQMEYGMHYVWNLILPENDRMGTMSVKFCQKTNVLTLNNVTRDMHVRCTVRDCNDSNRNINFYVKVVEDTERYAKISFQANGGAGNMADVLVEKGKIYILPECGFTAPKGMEFNCWKNSTDVQEGYHPGDAYADTHTDTVYFYAIWKTAMDTTSPVLLGAEAKADGITFTWKANAGVFKYAIFRKEAGGKWTKIAEATGSGDDGTMAEAGSTCTYVDQTAEVGKTYVYTARGINAKGKYITSYDMNGVTATMVEVLDKKSPVLDSATAGTNGITVTWTANSGVIKYAVFRKEAGGKYAKIAETTGSGNESVKAVAGTICSYVDGTAVAGKTYVYTVRGIDENGKYITNYDAKGVTVKMTSAEALDASSPVLGGATAGTNGITVTWTANSGVPKYAVFRKVSGGKWTKIAETTGSGDEGVKAAAGSTCSYADGTAEAGTTYTYTVRGLDESGNYVTNFNASGVSATMTSVEVLDASSPVLGNATAGANGITVTWTANSGVPKYAVFRKVTGGKWKKIAETTGSGNEGVKADAGSTCSYLDGTAEAGTTYTYTVRGLDEDGKYVTNFNANGVAATMTLPEVLDASSPVLGNAVAGADGITVTWTANSGVPKYAVFRKVAGGKWKKIAETTGSGDENMKAAAGSSCSYVDGSVAAGKTYIYTVRGLDESGKYVTNFDANGVSVTAE